MSYEVTIQDIRDYLSTLQPEDRAGDNKWVTDCLVARAIKWKYGVEKVYVQYIHFTVGSEGGERHPISLEVEDVIAGFDHIDHRYPTRAEVEAAMPYLRKDTRHED